MIWLVLVLLQSVALVFAFMLWRRTLSNEEQLGNSKTIHYAVICFLVLSSVFSIAAYTQLGEPKWREIKPSNGSENLILTLTNLLSQQPQNFPAWYVLGREHMKAGSPTLAVQSYQRAYVLEPQNIDLLLDYAIAVAALQNNFLIDEAAKLIQEALMIDNNHVQALGLAGIAAYQQGNYVLAKNLFNNALERSEQGSQDYQMISAYLNKMQTERIFFNIELTNNTVVNYPKQSQLFFVIRTVADTDSIPFAVKKVAWSDVDKPIQLDNSNIMLGQANAIEIDQAFYLSVAISADGLLNNLDYIIRNEPLSVSKTLLLDLK